MEPLVDGCQPVRQAELREFLGTRRLTVGTRWLRQLTDRLDAAVRFQGGPLGEVLDAAHD